MSVWSDTYTKFRLIIVQIVFHIKQSASVKTCFSFKITLFELAGILRNNLRLFKLDSNTLLVCNSVVTSAKWKNVKAAPTLILWKIFQQILLGEAFYKAIYDLRHKVTQTDFNTNCNTARQNRFPKFQFSNFVIK